ncbi:MAG TPA: HNH endonuclease [candidate division WWE3 bacterium]|uniref:HNH endonuclease n=1 Tax=candidate division WWE3 bacterium TaxID=2053526 RepID=A0A7C1DPN2_UNCKA|nr:HNH endonuclease [candidate division WWE3 bacterium]
MAGLGRSVIPAKLRRQAFYRDCGRCRRCGRKLSFSGRDAQGNRVSRPTFHHVVQKADGGINTLDNILTLCPRCHRIVDGNDRRRR